MAVVSTHLHTNNTQNNTNNNRTTQITTNLEECGPCPVFVSFTLTFALLLRKKHGQPSVRVRKTSARVTKTSTKIRKTSVTAQYTYYQNIHTLQNLNTRAPTHYKTHTLQNNIKPPQYKLKQTQCKIYPNGHNIIKYPQYKVTLRDGLAVTRTELQSHTPRTNHFTVPSCP